MYSPFAHYSIDEKAARIVGALIGMLAAATIFLPASLQLLAMALLVTDVSARAFSRPDLSLFTNVARRILWFFSIPPRRVDAAPKRFAARIGLCLVSVMVLAEAIGSRRLLLVSSMLLALLALLEAGLNFSTTLWRWTHLHRHEGMQAGTDHIRAG
jgi:Domain of unknown function (DUF4395)